MEGYMKHNSKPRRFKISLEWTSFFDEFRRAHSVFIEQLVVRIGNNEKKWVKSQVSQFRLDVDAGFHDNLGRYSVGAVIRDHFGHVVAASAKGIQNPGSVLAAEILAIRHGNVFALQHDISNLKVFSDSSCAINMIIDSTEMLNSDGSILCNVLEALKIGRVISMNHVSRTANKVAHVLAHYVLSHPSPCCWAKDLYPS